MLTQEFSYATCLQPAESKPWTVEDCFAGRGGADADNCHGGTGSDRTATCETVTAVP